MYIWCKTLRDLPRRISAPLAKTDASNGPRRAARASRIFLANFNGLFTRAGRVQIGPDIFRETHAFWRAAGPPRERQQLQNGSRLGNTERYVNGAVLISVICY